MFGISGSEFLVLLLVVIVVVGPRRLPEYTRRLTQLVRRLRLFLDNAKEQIAQEVGPELGELNLEDLNPRNYDPRKIVRDALGEDLDAIRRDLSSPFQSAVSTAERAGDEAVAAVRGAKPLSAMIDAEAGRAREAGSVSAAAPEVRAETATPEPAAPEPAAAPTAPEPARVPSSLVADRPAAPARPVSPRDIVRAARAAARTRPEAAVAVVDA
ncbi:MttA family protein [Actinomyces sp. oral taxon 414]|uniref:twin-arginine translocase TatA/TatE family subunit n=1 Tax=Actinomyces sp. oral taxon 414 TaxID=712122 RepID=UPI0006AE939D|nr:twin-arginine translocase TatA/TatE family subunit [Actinomyces sp. oral taxon 414]ALC98697.1 MttA family protein [Actinomyces sp. oral taxon 414]